MTFTNEHFDQLKAKIDLVKTGMLTTMDNSDYLFSRPMTSQQLDEDGCLWFFCPEHSTITEHLEHNTHVNVSFSDPARNLYVSLSGHASVSGDKQKIEQLWNPLVAAWYPQGMHDPQVALIKVHIHAAEYWDSDTGKMARLFSLLRAAITGHPPKGIAEHGRINC